MFVAFIMSALGITYYVGRYTYSRHKNSKADRQMNGRLQAMQSGNISFRSGYVDVEGSRAFRDRMFRDARYSLQIAKETTETLHRILGDGPGHDVHPYGSADSCRFLLAAFLHFVQNGRVYDWYTIARGKRPFGLPMEEAETVMRWGRDELRRRGVPIRIYKGWDTFGREIYTWRVPLEARTWIELI